MTSQSHGTEDRGPPSPCRGATALRLTADLSGGVWLAGIGGGGCRRTFPKPVDGDGCLKTYSKTACAERGWRSCCLPPHHLPWKAHPPHTDPFNITVIFRVISLCQVTKFCVLVHGEKTKHTVSCDSIRKFISSDRCKICLIMKYFGVS